MEDRGDLNPEVLKPKDTGFVFLPGVMPNGSKNITALREKFSERVGEENVFVPTSFASFFDESSPTLSLTFRGRIRKLANEIERRFRDKDKITIIGHSLGALETVELLKEVFERDSLKDKEFEVWFASTPGMAEKGVLNTLRRLRNITSNLGLLEQHIAYPLPEEYYEWEKKRQRTEEEEESIEWIWEDSENERLQRKQRFTSSLDIGKRLSVISIDKAILQAIKNNEEDEVKRLLEDRGRILMQTDTNMNEGKTDSFIDKLYKGKLIGDDIHKKWKEIYQEKKRLRSIISLISVGMFALPSVLRQLRHGFIDELSKIDVNGRNFHFGVLVFENDEMVKPIEIDNIVKEIEEKPSLDSHFEGVKGFREFAHSTLGYYPGPMVEFLSSESDNESR